MAQHKSLSIQNTKCSIKAYRQFVLRSMAVPVMRWFGERIKQTEGRKMTHVIVFNLEAKIEKKYPVCHVDFGYKNKKEE